MLIWIILYLFLNFYIFYYKVIKENIELKTMISKQSTEIKFLQSKVRIIVVYILNFYYISFLKHELNSKY
jgi:hypothetical protein